MPKFRQMLCIITRLTIQRKGNLASKLAQPMCYHGASALLQVKSPNSVIRKLRGQLSCGVGETPWNSP